jgi:hypothetical protein
MTGSTLPDSDDVQRIRPGEDIPRLEPWLVVSFLSLLPAGVSIAVPSIAVAGWIATGILLSAGIAMFVRDALKNR